MDIVNYKDLNLKFKQETGTEININGKKVFVYDYCSTQDANEILAMTLNKSFEGGVFNPVKTKRYFLLYYVYVMTNIDFDDEDRADELFLFNTLDSNGVFEKVIEVTEDIFVELNEQLEDVMQQNLEYGASIGGVVTTFAKELKKYSDDMLKNLDNFDVDKYQQMLDAIGVAKAKVSGGKLN